MVFTTYPVSCTRYRLGHTFYVRAMEGRDAFASVAQITFPAGSRVLRSSWCPDKDLLVAIHKFGSKDKLSLWKMHGAKKWEVELDASVNGKEEVVDIAWSPDGMQSSRNDVSVCHVACI